MKKFLILALATLFVAGMIADTAVAEDRLSLNGEVRVRAWDVSGKTIDLENETVADSDQTYWDQRFRVGSTINVADGVKGILRFDFAEDKWGSDNWTGVRYSEASEFQVDRAYLQVDKGMFSVSAGQQLIGLGNYIAYDNNGTGIKLSIKTPVVITLGYTKESERGSLEDESDDGTDDLDTWLVDVGYAADNFAVHGFYATMMDGNEDGLEPNVIGVTGMFKAGMMTINAELNMFGGQFNDDIDVMGTQFWGNAEFALMDNLKVGVDLVYSDGNDFEDDEIKITALNDWGDFHLADRGPFVTEITPMGGSDVFDPTPFALTDQVLELAGFDIDDGGSVVGTQGGSMGGGVYATFTVVENLDLSGQVMYLSSDEDDVYDSVLTLNVGADWMFAPNSHIWLQYSKTDWSSDIDVLDDSYDVIVAQLSINF